MLKRFFNSKETIFINTGIFNENWLWYFDICDKTFIIKSKSKLSNSKTHVRKRKHGNVVKKNDFVRPKIGEVKYILNDTIEDCRKEDFPSFEYRCVNDIKFKKMGNNEELMLTNIFGYMKFKDWFLWIKKKNQKWNEKWI